MWHQQWLHCQTILKTGAQCSGSERFLSLLDHDRKNCLVGIVNHLMIGLAEPFLDTDLDESSGIQVLSHQVKLNLRVKIRVCNRGLI
eukprot:4698714-Ditylum_brightwellii.AAC.1